MADDSHRFNGNGDDNHQSLGEERVPRPVDELGSASGEIREGDPPAPLTKRLSAAAARSRATVDDNGQPAGGGLLARLANARSSSLPIDPKFAKDYPTLWEIFTVREGMSADGKNTTTLTLLSEGTGFTCIVNLKSAGLSLVVSLPLLTGFFRALEDEISDPAANWRPIKDWKAKQEPKKGKEKAGDG